MYCKECGAEIEDNAKFCTACGTTIIPGARKADNPQVIYVERRAPRPPKSGFAIAGFVVSLALLIPAVYYSFARMIILALSFIVISFVLSLVGLLQTAKGKRTGKGFAIAGMVLSLVTCFICLFFYINIRTGIIG